MAKLAQSLFSREWWADIYHLGHGDQAQQRGAGWAWIAAPSELECLIEQHTAMYPDEARRRWVRRQITQWWKSRNAQPEDGPEAG